jgi:hypothetical protein
VIDTQIILVLGAPGGGTSATAAVLAGLGVPVPGPYEQNDDPLTPCSYESSTFTHIIQRAVNEHTLEYTDGYQGRLTQELHDLKNEVTRSRLVRWKRDQPRRVAFKRPMAAFCLPELIEIFEPTVIVVRRPLEDVERTRLRRAWPNGHGPERAPAILHMALYTLGRYNWPFLNLSFPELVRDTDRAVGRIIDFAHLEDLAPNLPNAVAQIRRAS